jgi:hypothetical protein
MHGHKLIVYITLFKAIAVLCGTDGNLQNIFTFRENMKNIPHNTVNLTEYMNVRNIPHNIVSSGRTLL